MTTGHWIMSWAYIGSQDWLERGVEFPTNDISPGYVLEKWMGLDGVCVRRATSKSLTDLSFQKFPDKQMVKFIW